MSTDTPRILEAKWKFQPVLIRVGPEETLDLKAMIDNGAGISCVPEQVVDRFNLWDRVEIYIPNHTSMNKKYIRLLHRIRPKIKQEQQFRKSKLRFLHYAMVRWFNFDESTTSRRRIAQGWDSRYPYYSVGKIRLEYVPLEQVKDEDEIPQMPWRTLVFEVVDSSGRFHDRPDLDMLMGLDSGIPDEEWYQGHKSQHSRWRKARQAIPLQ